LAGEYPIGVISGIDDIDGLLIKLTQIDTDKSVMINQTI